MTMILFFDPVFEEIREKTRAMKINHILVPIDFSESSKNALKSAIKIAKKAEAKITMVNAVHMHTPLPHLKGGSLMQQFIADYEWQVKESFNELESEVVELKEVPHEEERFLSYLTDAIYTETQTKDIDLIVMGTRSQHTIGERLLGSNSIDIIKTSEVPVLVIPESFHEFAPKTIGFASDFLQTRAWSLNMLKALGHLYGAEVMVFHIADEIGADEQKQIDRIKKNLSSLEHFSIRIVAADSVVEGIKEFSASHHLDVLAMMPREHNLFERLFVKSVTKEIAIDIDIPLLTFHP